jgi:uncharacterized protein
MTNGADAIAAEQVPAAPGQGRPIAPVWHTVVLLVVIVSLSALQGLPRLANPGLQPNRLATYILTLVYEILLLGYVWLIRVMKYKVPLRELIGGKWRRPLDFFRDAGIAVLFWLAVVGMLIAARLYLHFSGIESARSMFPQTFRELVVFVVLAVFAGFCEEIIFRGYFQRQFTAWTSSVPMGIVLQAIVFGSAHIYQGWRGVVVISVYGAMFGILAAICKSLRPGMIQHCTQDGFSGIAVWVAQQRHIPLPAMIRF